RRQCGDNPHEYDPGDHRSDDPRAAGKNEGHGPRTLDIAGFQRLDSEAGRSDQIVRLAIQPAAARKLLPDGSEPVLPAGNARLWRTAVLGEQEPAAWTQDPAYLGERRRGILDRAQSEGHDRRVDAVILDRQRLAGAAHKLDGNPCFARALVRESQQLRRWIDAK